MSDKYVEGFCLVSQNLTQIPSGIESFFPNSKGFRFYDSHLRIVSKDVSRFPHLRLLFLYYNELATLDGDLFEFAPTHCNARKNLVHFKFTSSCRPKSTIKTG